jgi:hypothetical protein
MISPARILIPAPDRHGFASNRQRNQNHFGRHGKQRDPRQLLLAGRYPQAVQRDLSQPRTKRALSRHQQAETALLA